MISPRNRCPKCNAELVRVRRTGIDRLISEFVPIKRMQCSSKGCGWQGTVQRTTVRKSTSAMAVVLTIVAIIVGVVISVTIVKFSPEPTTIQRNSRAR